MPAAAPRRTTHDAEVDPRNRDLRIWVDGVLVPKDEAKVSVYDSGFILGDGLWEGLRLHRGAWVLIEEHLDRLFASARVIALDLGADRAGLTAALDATARVNGMTTDAHARLMITRRIKVRPFQHPSLSRSGPTTVIVCEHSRPAPPSSGVRLATVPQVRGLPMSQAPKLNSHSKLNCVIACLQAERAGADEALMLDPRGFVSTTNACNFFMVRGGALLTSTGAYCMNGVTRGKVLMLARAAGIETHKRDFSVADVMGADEAFLTGGFGGLTPVAALDDQPIGEGGPGSLTLRLAGKYRTEVDRYAEAAAGVARGSA